MNRSMFVMGVLWVAGAALGASPFADKTCLSYSSPSDGHGGSVEIPWSSLQPDDFGPLQVSFDSTGVRQLRPVPAPGVHPRILCTPQDLPDIQRRLRQTKCGQQVWRDVLCWIHGMKGDYDARADYAQPDVMNGSFHLHGPVQLFRLGSGWETGERYRRLVNGDTTEPAGYFWNVYPLEALRCLLENDEPAARDLARAVVTSMEIDQAAREAENQQKHRQGPPDQPVGGMQLAWTYDLLFKYLDPQQRQLIHDELANGTWHHDNYGTFNEATAARSNWATFSYWLIETLAIEGEPGFNDLKVAGMYRGWRNMLTYGWFRNGATYEGEAKQQLGMDGVIAFALRGYKDNLCGHPYLQAYARNFLPHSIIPPGGGFVKYDLLGGARGGSGFSSMDAVGLKYMFPDDKVIDWCYRNQVGEHYERVADRPDGYYNGLLFYALYASDFDPSNDDPAKLGLSPTFFCGERSLMMTRSDWGRDALMLDMHTRGNTGGHPYADRNSILLVGQGVVWSDPQSHNAFGNFCNSEVVIDDKPQDVTVPGRMVDFVDSPLATFAVGDAKYAWDWHWKRIDGKPHNGGEYTRADVAAGRVDVPAGWEAETHCTDDFALSKRADEYLHRPLFEQPSWIARAGVVTPVVRQKNYPVQRAFRTAGLVRGEHPYALVIDDVQKDGAAHHYDWNLTLERNIQITNIKDNGNGQCDVYLTSVGLPENPKQPLDERFDGTPAVGQPMLLVRVLQRKTDGPSEPKLVREEMFGKGEKQHDSVRRLVVPADAVSPDFKVLLYAYRQGDALPRTSLAGDTLTVDDDTVTFKPGASGKTDLSVARAGKTLIEVNRPIKPLE